MTRPYLKKSPEQIELLINKRLVSLARRKQKHLDQARYHARKMEEIADREQRWVNKLELLEKAHAN